MQSSWHCHWYMVGTEMTLYLWLLLLLKLDRLQDLGNRSHDKLLPISPTLG